MTRILILVEDDDHKAKAVTRYAERAGYRVERATVAVEAEQLLDLFAKDRPIVLTDWSFPLRKNYGATDGAGMTVVAICRDYKLDVRVFSGRDVPAPGYEDIWFDALSANGLMAWLEEEAKKT